MTDARMIAYDFWLTFSSNGTTKGAAPRVTKSEPQVSRGERAVRCAVKLPATLFSTPSIVFEVNMPVQEADTFVANVTPAVEAFKQMVGFDIDVKFVENEQ